MHRVGATETKSSHHADNPGVWDANISIIPRCTWYLEFTELGASLSRYADILHLISERFIVAGAELPKVSKTVGDGTRRCQKRHFNGAPSAEAPQRQVRDDHTSGRGRLFGRDVYMYAPEPSLKPNRARGDDIT